MQKNDLGRMDFTLKGRLRPYVRMTRNGKFTSKAAQQYLASQQAIGWQIKEQMQANGWQMLPGQTPLDVDIEIVVSERLHTFDIDNAGKAILDAANGVIWPDDRWIDRLRILRRLGRRDEIFLTVKVTETLTVRVVGSLF